MEVRLEAKLAVLDKLMRTETGSPIKLYTLDKHEDRYKGDRYKVMAAGRSVSPWMGENDMWHWLDGAITIIGELRYTLAPLTQRLEDTEHAKAIDYLRRHLTQQNAAFDAKDFGLESCSKIRAAIRSRSKNVGRMIEDAVWLARLAHRAWLAYRLDAHDT